MIEIKDVEKSYGKQRVLSGLNLSVPDGSVFGMVGVNGAGKSTLLRLMAGVLKADRGEILYGGKDVFDNTDVKKEIFFLPDEPYYGSNTTGRQLAELYTAYYAFDSELFQKWCGEFALNDAAPIQNFSKGMKRQIFIALALAARPKYLLLDEAFDGLDPNARLQFKRALIGLSEETGCTTVIASHSLRELSDICTDFALIGGGTVTDGGNLQDSLMSVHKFQAAFDRMVGKEDFPFECIKFECAGRVAKFIVRGNKDTVIKQIEAMHPLFVEEIAVDFEEYFLIETEQGRSNK